MLHDLRVVLHDVRRRLSGDYKYEHFPGSTGKWFTGTTDKRSLSLPDGVTSRNVVRSSANVAGVRLYRHRVLQLNMPSSAFIEIYKNIVST